MSRMLVHVDNLRSGPQRYAYSKYAEAVASSALRHKGWVVESTTSGLDERYDFIAGGKKVEVKFSSHEALTVEFARGDNTPSGIFATEADFYLTVNRGWSRTTGIRGDVRLYSVKKLKQYVINALLTNPAVVAYDTGSVNTSSKTVKVEPDAVMHEKLGTVVYDAVANTFDFGETDGALWPTDFVQQVARQHVV